MKTLMKLPTLVLAIVLSIGSVMVAAAQDATPDAADSEGLGSPVAALECWSDEPD